MSLCGAIVDRGTNDDDSDRHPAASDSIVLLPKIETVRDKMAVSPCSLGRHTILNYLNHLYDVEPDIFCVWISKTTVRPFFLGSKNDKKNEMTTTT